MEKGIAIETPAEVSVKRPWEKLFRGDRALWIIIAALAVVSLLVVYSSTASMAYKNAGGNTAYYFFNQLKFIVVSFAAVFFIHRVDYQTYARYARLLFVFSLGLMVLTFFVGVNLNEASRWLRIPGTGYTIQPSDFIKVTLVLVLARELSKRQALINKTPLLPVVPLFHKKFSEQRRRQNRQVFYETTLPLLLPVVLACGAIFFSNLSTAALTFFPCLVMLYIGRVRAGELWRLVRMVVVVMVVALFLMSAMNVGRADTWVKRIKDFAGIEMAEEGAAQSDDLQVEQAKIAIASGGIFGKGPGLSTQRANLPHSYSDFAYAFIVEEYGLVGAFVVLALYLWLFFRTVVIFQKCERAFPSLLVLGLGIMIVLQAIFNMLVSVNLFPVTGQTLPLISLGGSSLLFTSVALGMILGVSRQMEEKTLGSAGEDGVK
ncbi:MAG: FtsW/RodA/SpoVE family cell cycle protein [Rikenellaceae bacterium]|nr:FtsW/RodA/SpoVE family cell cycle protein [Rikenellaceae bacterium]